MSSSWRPQADESQRLDRGQQRLRLAHLDLDHRGWCRFLCRVPVRCDNGSLEPVRPEGRLGWLVHAGHAPDARAELRLDRGGPQQQWPGPPPSPATTTSSRRQLLPHLDSRHSQGERQRPHGALAAYTSAASSPGPVVITTNSTAGLASGEAVYVYGVGGNTAANGFWIISVLNGTQFALLDSNGNGTYTGGGTWLLEPNSSSSYSISPLTFVVT